MIKSVSHVQVSIPVGSEDEAREFYCNVLGLREIPKPKSLAGRGGFWLAVGGFQVHFGTEAGVDRAKSKAHVAYLVEDLEAARNKLIAAGCEPQDGIPIPGYDRFEFRDPFGNRVEFLATVSSDKI
ncbi:MAG: VOC family protein [Acidobacteria bacterium]|nr:VOC family protein [Acidobacteriota bacterium]